LPGVLKYLKMIQRIQSIYLSFTILLSLLFFKGSVFSFIDKSGKFIKLMSEGTLNDSGGRSFVQIGMSWPLPAILILIPLLSLVTLLSYKKRKIQLLLSLALVILSIGLLITLSWYSCFIINKYNSDIIPGFKMALPVLILIFTILAFRGILKDLRLIKSYDRLR